MTAEAKSKQTRGHEHRFTIDASPAEVWKAITDAEHLANWFPMEAQVAAGVGGKINYGWAPDMQNPCAIEIWEPQSHLRTTWMEPVVGDAEGKTGATVVDWFIEGDGGKTILRLVHSGFGSGSDWENDYDGSNRGWEYELRSLCHYLKYHLGTRRKMISVRQAVSVPPAEVWKRLMGPEGLAPSGGAGALAENNAYSFKTAAGDGFKGEVTLSNSPLDFAGTITNMNNALFRFAHETCFGKPEAFIFISTWGVDEEENKQLEGRLTTLLKGLFA
jgi:uncharacterized protein YndB with AHSA1/START domain